MTVNTIKSATIAIQDEDELMRIAIRLGAAGLEALTDEANTSSPEASRDQPANEERFKFGISVDDRPARAYLESITFGNDKSATGTGNTTVFLSPVQGDRYHFTLTRRHGTWSVKINQVVAIDNG